MDEPERLDLPRGAARLRLLASRGGAGPPTRRLWWTSRLGEGALSIEREILEGGALARANSFAVSGGCVAIQDPGLVGEVAGVTRRTRAVGVSRGANQPFAARPATGAACDLEGAAIGWNGRVGVAGGTRRRDVGQALAIMIGGQLRPLAMRAIQVRAGTRRELYGSVAIRRVDPGRLASVEAGAGPSGPFGRLGLEAREGRLDGAARYQFEPWRDRPGSLDLEGAWASRNAAARVRWRSWTGPATPRSATSAPEDDGRVEVDLRLGGTRGGGACRIRAGSRPRQADGSGGERFVVGDWIVARERGRTLRFVGGRRDAQMGNDWRRGRSAGSLLELEWGDRAAMTLSVEAVRADGGGGSYGPGLDVSETGSLRARSRSGVRAAARGWVRIGAWRMGAAADDEDDGFEFDETTSGARRAPRVTLWLAWSGGELAP